MKHLIRKIAPFISVLFFGLALFFLNRELGQYSLSSILDYISQISALQIIGSLLLCAASYWVLTVYEALSVKNLGKKLSYSKTAKAGFIGYGFSHSLGMSFLTGGSIRYRLYSAWEFSALDVSKIVGFNALTFWMGFCTAGGLTLLLYSTLLPQDIIAVSLPILGISLLAVISIYCAANVFVQREISVGRWTFSLPGPEMTGKQIVISCFDWLISTLVLYVLLPRSGIPFLGFFGVFMLAQVAGFFSQIPAGLGVFESIILLYLSNFAAPSSVLGILLIYRLIYYVLPLSLAAIVLGHQEYHANKHKVKKFKNSKLGKLPLTTPKAVGAFIFIGGVLTYLTKGLSWILTGFFWLERLLSVPVMELSRLFSTLTGALKMILAHGFAFIHLMFGTFL
jgi:phosphatidylglycerol lysyltransferase